MKSAQRHAADAGREMKMLPKLEFAFEVRATLLPRLKLDNPPIGGSRLSVPVGGGEFEGPRLRGKVLAHGGEFPHLRPDGVLSFDARYFMQEDDGTLIYIQNRGYRHGPPEVMDRLYKLAPGDTVDPSLYYFRCTPTFETPAGKHDWLTRHVFIGLGERFEQGNKITYYTVL
jgi:hypothetical protein